MMAATLVLLEQDEQLGGIKHKSAPISKSLCKMLTNPTSMGDLCAFNKKMVVFV